MATKTTKILHANTYVSWFLMLAMMLVMAVAYFTGGFPWPGLAVAVTVVGMVWAMAGLGINLMLGYFAYKQKAMGLWALSAAMSVMSFCAFMNIAATY